MRLLIVFVLLFAGTAHAEMKKLKGRRPTSATSASVKLLRALRASPAVTGAIAEAKAWSGAASCGAPVIESLTKDSFVVSIACHNPGDPKEEAKAGVGLEADANVEVTGSIFDTPDHPTIDKIELQYAG